jgi:hypothetical protein
MVGDTLGLQQTERPIFAAEEMTQFRSLLGTLMSVLKGHGSGFGVDAVERALAGSDEDLEAFLVSNVLWGGAGSIADQAGGDRAAR